jgi:hypothetical protein
LVICPSCDGGLVGNSGFLYPLDKIPVKAKRSDIQNWVSEGHKIEFLNEDDRPLVLLTN